MKRSTRAAPGLQVLLEERDAPRPQRFLSMGAGRVGDHLEVTQDGIFTSDPNLALYGSNVGLSIRMNAGADGCRPAGRPPAIASGPPASTPAGARAVALAQECLTPVEMLSSNTGYYHDVAHPVNVAGAVAELSRGLGRDPTRVRFLQQVALLHDFDERMDLAHIEKGPLFGVPARVQVTLAWMDKNRAHLLARLHWSLQEFVEAQGLIARTDYPFDTTRRQYGTDYDGRSPQALYRSLLHDLPPNRRCSMLQEGVVLSFADQVANYLGSEAQAEAAIYGLAHELRVCSRALLKRAAEFHQSIGTDIEVDRSLARELDVAVDLPDREQLELWLSPESRRNLRNNRAFFRRVADRG